MTREEIIRMAREAGLALVYSERDEDGWRELERFAALVTAAERERCARACDSEAEKYTWYGEDGDFSSIARLCADAIRARGQE